jgi:16S rRNA (uracil1498-N3)-methyltransferase
MDGCIRLSASASHHLLHVMRAEPGSRVTVFDGTGREADARLNGQDAGEALLCIESERVVECPALCPILFQSVPKGKRMDLIVEKAVELGVSEIHPILASRGIVKLAGEQAVVRSRRWQRVALSAAKQCGAAWLPDVRVPTTLADACDELEACDVLLLACLRDDSAPLRSVLQGIKAEGVSRVGLLVGPEGDWTDEETALALDAGATMVSYGQRVLRVETAALYGLSALAYEFGE